MSDHASLHTNVSRTDLARARLLYYGRDVVEATWKRMQFQVGDGEITTPLPRSNGHQSNCQQGSGLRLPTRADDAIGNCGSPRLATTKTASNSNRPNQKDAAFGQRYCRGDVRRLRHDLIRYGRRPFDESKHPRAPAGRPDGGQFVDLARRLDMSPSEEAKLHKLGRDVAKGTMRGLFQSFIVDGLGGWVSLAIESARATARAAQSLPGLFRRLAGIAPAMSRQLVTPANQNHDEKLQSEIRNALAGAKEFAQKSGANAEFIVRLAAEIHNLTPQTAALLQRNPEELEGKVSDEFLILAIITQDTVKDFRELIEHAKDLDAETKAYLISYLFGTVLYEAAELYATKAAGTYTKSAKFGRLLKKLEDLPLVGKNPRIKAIMSNLTLKIAKLLDTQVCFVAGTKVHTPAGLINIEDLQSGDLVLSRDEHDVTLIGPVVVRPVLRRVITRPRHLWRVTVRIASGKIETLVTTGNHPFFVLDHLEFVPAAALAPGYLVATGDGQPAEVVRIDVKHAAPGTAFTTYNLEVEATHTYFVGRCGVWVHNSSRLMCEMMDVLYERYKSDGLSDRDAKYKIMALLKRRIDSGRISKEAAKKHFDDALRLFEPGATPGIRKMSPTEALEMGLMERDTLWPKRGLHKTEKHHLMMEGKSFWNYWKERGITRDDINRFTITLDADIHQAISSRPEKEEPWWDKELMGLIEAQEKQHKRKLKREEVLQQIDKLLIKLSKLVRTNEIFRIHYARRQKTFTQAA